MDQLFVFFKTECWGKPLSKARLSWWVVETIQMAFKEMDGPPLFGLRAHSAQGVATSWALLQGASLKEICDAATWSSPSTFTKFYRLNVSTSPSFGELVVGATRNEHVI